MLGGVAAITLIVSVLLYRPFLVLSFNEQKAQILGAPTSTGSRGHACADHPGHRGIVPDGWHAFGLRTARRPGSDCGAPRSPSALNDGHSSAYWRTFGL